MRIIGVMPSFSNSQKDKRINKLTKSLFGKYAECFEEMEKCVCVTYKPIPLPVLNIHEDKNLGLSFREPHLSVSYRNGELRLVCVWIKDKKWKQFLNHIECGEVEETDDATKDTIYYWWGLTISLSDPECSQKCIQIHERIKEYFDNYASSDL